MTIQSIRFSYLCTFITLFCAVYSRIRTYIAESERARDRCALKFSSITIILFIHHYFIRNVRAAEMCVRGCLFLFASILVFFTLPTLVPFHSIRTLARSLFSAVSVTHHQSHVYDFVKFPSVFLVVCRSFCSLTAVCCRLIRCFSGRILCPASDSLR